MANKVADALGLYNQYNNVNNTNVSSTSKQDNTNIFEKISGTFARINRNLDTGILKAIEGVVDLPANLVSGVLDLVGLDDTSDNINNFIKKDLTNEYVMPFLDDIANFGNGVGSLFVGGGMGDIGKNVSQTTVFNSGGKGERMLDTVSTSVGEMLPSILVGNVAGVVGASAKVAKIASLTSFGLGAGGQASEQALNNGATTGQALTYGTLSGATEVATEMLVDGAINKALGIGGTGLDTTKIANNIAKKLGGSRMAQLGSQLLVDASGEGLEEVTSDILDPFWKKLTYDKDLNVMDEITLENLLESYVSGALTSLVMGGATTNVNTSISNNIMEDIKTTKENYRNGIIDTETYNQTINGYVNELNGTLSKMNNETKEDYIKEQLYNRNNLFNGYDTTNNTFNQEEVNKYTKVGNVEVNIDTTIEGNNAKATEVKNIANELNKVLGVEQDYVLEDFSTNDTINTNADGYYSTVDGKIHLDINSKQAYSKVISHELTHILEGTTGYDLIKSYMSTIGINNYEEQITSKIAEYKALGQDLTQEQAEKEVIANNIAEIFSDEKAVNDFVNKDKSTAKKILEWLKNTISNIGKSKEEKIKLKVEKAKLTTIKNLFENALEGNYEGKNISNAVGEVDTTLSKAFIQYSLSESDPNSTTEKILTEIPKNTEKLPITSWLKISLIDAQSGIIDLAKKSNNKTFIKEMEVKVNYARASNNASQYAMMYGILDENGKPLTKGVEQIYKALEENNIEYNVFDDYLYHRHNLDRSNDYVEKNVIKLNKKTGERVEVVEREYYKKMVLTEDTRTYINDLYSQGYINQEIYDLICDDSNEITIKNVLPSKLRNALAKYIEERNALIKEIENTKKLFNKHKINEVEYEEKIKALNSTLEKTKYRKSYFKSILDKLTKIKPVFEENITKTDSEEVIKKYEEQYPSIKEQAEEVYNYLNELQNMRVKHGLITEEDQKLMSVLYPNYVPTSRFFEEKNMSTQVGANRTSVNNGIKTATGSDRVLLPIRQQMERMTQSTYKACALNDMLNGLYNQALIKNVVHTDGTTTDEDGNRILDNDIKDNVIRRITNIEQIDFENAYTKENEVSFYVNGEKVVCQIDNATAIGYKALLGNTTSVEKRKALKILNKVNSTFKALITNYNPAFTIRNGVKDFQNALMYTKFDIATFNKNYTRAWQEISNNGTYWQMYQSVGGLYSSFFDYNEGIKADKVGWKKVVSTPLDKIEHINMVVEQLPRLSEFISSIESGMTTQEALFNANEITLNYGKSGTIVKGLNNTIIPFLNAKVQGSLKFAKTFISKKTSKQWGVLLTRVALLAIAPNIINKLLYDDDDDFESLKQTDKDNYYLVKIGNYFIKIPKGQFNSVVSTVFNRSVEYANGDKSAFEGALTNISSEISPVDNFRTIFSPFTDVKTNTTWYGGVIESSKYNNTRPSERYDETTNKLAIAIGKVLNYSPLKIQYLINQYTGVIGDIILTKPNENAITNLFKDFVLDPTYQNKYSEKFYATLEKEQYNKTSGSSIAKAKVKYLSSIRTKLQDLYDKKKEINTSSLSKTEKLAQLRVVQGTINTLLKEGLDNLEGFSECLNTFDLSSEAYDDSYREATRQYFGAELAIKEYNSKTYTKAVALNKLGVSYDDFYKVYFTCKDYEGELDEEGNTISGSKRNAIFNYINTLSISTDAKYLLFSIFGYKTTNSAKLISKVKSNSKLSKEEKESIISILE